MAGSDVADDALVRNVGGNVADFAATGRWDYDVRFANWQPLPAPLAAAP